MNCEVHVILVMLGFYVLFIHPISTVYYIAVNELQQQPMYIYALSNSLCDIEVKYSSSSFHNAPHNCFYSESDKRYR